VNLTGGDGQFRARVRFFVRGIVVFLALLPIVSATDAQAPPGPSSQEIIQFLTQTVSWYRSTQQERYLATEPSDLAFLADNRQTADQVVRLAFDFAKEEDQRRAKQSSTSSGGASSQGLSQYEGMVQSAAAADDLVKDTQAEVDSLRAKLAASPATKKRQVQTQLAETQSELDLFQARQQALHSMVEFLGGAATGKETGGLRAQIEELAHSVPAALTSGNTNQANSPAEQASPKTTDLSGGAPGLWALAGDLFRLSSKSRALANNVRATDALQASSQQLRVPLRNALKQLIQTGNQVAIQADTSDVTKLTSEKQQLDALTTQFKQISAALAPLGKQGILLDLYKRNLSSWQADVSSDFKDKSKSLLLKVLGLAGVLAVVFVIGEIWKRGIDRYVRDHRRRHQFLLMRRIMLWIALAIVLMFTFVTELGAVATFAGLITAGVAVALQNVIVSIVGYFFLIGKYGIRVGDRVQVGGVTGEVVEIGLVRFHLMELSSSEIDAEPTGRVVAFSNSVVFQSTAGLFKQIPGTDFIWHEISLKFAPENSYAAIRDRMEQAIDEAFADYRDSLERQRRQIETSLSAISTAELKPRIRVRFTVAAIEVVIRFPVASSKGGEIDGRIMSAVFGAVDRNPKLSLIGSSVPAVKA
jgi:small-conductance mechanosensitive channel